MDKYVHLNNHDVMFQKSSWPYELAVVLYKPEIGDIVLGTKPKVS